MNTDAQQHYKTRQNSDNRSATVGKGRKLRPIQPRDQEDRISKTPLEAALRARCARKDHDSWIRDYRSEYVGYTIEALSSWERPATPDDARVLGYMPASVLVSEMIRRCHFCRYKTDPEENLSVIGDAYARTFGEPPLPYEQRPRLVK